MFDALTSLAFSVQSSKGIYALLLGSGLSTAAGIPTGWDVTVDLIRKAAAADKEECGTDVAAWYKSKHGSDANYSQLLDGLAKTPAGRTNLLAAYFEPNSEDLGKGLKTPTAAHKSIARLVSRGYFRVIVTTNFDRLLERALENEGISPTVISTADAARGAPPLAHARCTLIKANGDYRDTRIKNTVAELESYDADMDRLLDQVFDEYGLIVCGWSAAWDKALRDALLRCPIRRFTTYWTRRASLSNEARNLVNHRKASELEIESADAFLTTLEAKLDAIERYSEPHPASAKLAVGSLKKFIAEDRYRIQLHDLVTLEAEGLLRKLTPLPVTIPGLTAQQIFERMKVYEGTSETLVALLAHGCFWGGATHWTLWGSTVARVAQLRGSAGGMTHLLSLRTYPACLLFYASGLGAIASRNYQTLTAICRDTKVQLEGDEKPLNDAVLPWNVLDVNVARQFPGYERHHTPINDRLFDVLRDPLREYLPSDSAYEEAFDRFEYLTSLVELDLRMSNRSLVHAPVGCFGWRRHYGKDIVDRISKEASLEGDRWPVITSKLFPSIERFREIEGAYREGILRNLAWF